MIYEFRCSRCGRRFDVYATLAEKEAGLSPTCPSCGSTDVSRVFGRVIFLRPSGKDGGDAPSDAREDSGDLGFGGDDFDGDFGGDGSGDGFGDDFGSNGEEGFASEGEGDEESDFGDDLGDGGFGPGRLDDER